jgi:hypothetical protein
MADAVIVDPGHTVVGNAETVCGGGLPTQGCEYIQDRPVNRKMRARNNLFIGLNS